MQVDLKKLKPLGIVLILGCAILAFITCVTADMGVPPRYESKHEPEYYRQSEETMQELVSELEEFVFPNIEGINDYYIDTETMTLWIWTTEEYAKKIELVIQRDFGTELIQIGIDVPCEHIH